MAVTRTYDGFPHAIREIENVFFTLSDGTRLAARIWLPEDAEKHPVPAILEYLPYRNDDCTAYGDALRHPYFAAHGYAAVRVDMRGTGDSDGLLLDEYLKQEQDHALKILDWIATQPWCNGNIGLYGISWGGFNGLQIAARRPPQLKSVLSLCSTDDRWREMWLNRMQHTPPFVEAWLSHPTRDDYWKHGIATKRRSRCCRASSML